MAWMNSVTAAGKKIWSNSFHYWARYTFYWGYKYYQIKYSSVVVLCIYFLQIYFWFIMWKSANFSQILVFAINTSSMYSYFIHRKHIQFLAYNKVWLSSYLGFSFSPYPPHLCVCWCLNIDTDTSYLLRLNSHVT